MAIKHGRRRLLLGIATLIPPAMGILLFWARSREPPPTADEVCALAQANRFDEAETRGTDYLRLAPGDSRVLLVMAEIALARPAPDPIRGACVARSYPSLLRIAGAWALLDQGKAFYLLSRYDRSESCWMEALRQDPAIVEAGRRLLDLFVLQGRFTEASGIILPQLNHEPDPRDRLLLLLELVQLEVDPPEPWSIVKQLQPVVQANPADLPTSVACGLALVSVSRSDEGLSILRRAVDSNPAAPTAWDALLNGLEMAYRSDEWTAVWTRLPHALATDPRFAKHLARLHEETHRWSDAARAYRRSWEYAPDNTVGYRLRRALFLSGQTEEAARWDRLVLDYRDAFKQARRDR